MHIRCPHCENAIEYVQDVTQEIRCTSCNSQFRITGEETLSHAESSGKMIAHFRVVRVQGSGAFGTVYQALDTKLDREVALKVPRFDESSAELEAQFLSEAQAAAQIRHPNIVGVHEIGRTQDRLYIVSDFIHGVTLGEWTRARKPDEKTIAHILLKVLSALTAAHESHIIHRDLKPSNILMDLANEPYVADFGLAKRQAPEEITITHDGRILGTPAYMPPEQARGEGYAATPASDIYSIGVILYEMLTGKRPFESTNSRLLLYQVMTTEPKPPRTLEPGTSKDLQTICLKAMEKDPEQRYQSAAEMAADLQNFVDGKPITARPISPFERGRRWAVRNKALATAGSVIAVLCLTSLALFFRDGTNVVVVSPEQTRHRILVETSPPNADLAVVRLNDRDRTWQPDDVIYSSSVTPCELELTPGNYLVVARQGDRFHEVFRHVPDDPQSTPAGQEPHHLWSVGPKESGARLMWPRFNLFSESEVAQKMVNVPPGSFQFAKEGTCGIPAGLHSVDEFFMDPTEVTNADFNKVCGTTSSGSAWGQQPNAPVRGVNWDKAVMFAELVGKRLPAELEFEFARTNRGRTVFPWGNDPKKIRDWSLSEPASYDVNEMGIRGLYSSVAEWTNTDLFHFNAPDNPVIVQTLQNRRTFVGGDASVANGEPSPTTWCQGTEIRFAESTFVAMEGVGFRCVRSKSPGLFSLKRPTERAARRTTPAVR